MKIKFKKNKPVVRNTKVKDPICLNGKKLSEQTINDYAPFIPSWNEREELGDEIENILDEIGYVSPIPKSDDIIKRVDFDNKETKILARELKKSVLQFTKDLDFVKEQNQTLLEERNNLLE